MTTCTQYNRRSFNKALMAGAIGIGLAARSHGTESPLSFDLGPDQTPTRNQQNRGTCYVYAVVAALEAAYKRAGYGAIDLSEEFANDALRLLWLHPVPSASISAHRRENFFCAEGGGFSNGVVELMTSCGFAVPKEQSMPYRPTLPFGYDSERRIVIDPRWEFQYNVGSFNLYPGRFDSVRLSFGEYYGADDYESHVANDPEMFEQVLLAGREIVWEFLYPGKSYAGHSQRIWEYTGPALETNGKPKWNDVGGHAMMIYGFNKTNPAQPYFLVKNSWGKQDTFVSYEYVRRLGMRAVAINKIASPRSWPELACIGRWSLQVDGRRGVFDLYHLPGMSQTAFVAFNRIDRKTGRIEEDRRVGTFFLGGNPRNACRVNGFIGPDGMRLNIDWGNRECPYGHRGGQEFTLRFAGTNFDVLKGKLVGGINAGEEVTAYRLRDPRHFNYV